jgi:hypothetical protein
VVIAARTSSPSAHRPLDRSIDDLFAFPHVQDWVSDELRHATKREAFEMKAERARETSELTVRRNALKKERAECQELLAWSEENEEAFETALEEIKTRTTALKAEKKKLLMRTRKYRLYPTNQQKKTLRQFFGTCRWTYNQAVAHFRLVSISIEVDLLYSNGFYYMSRSLSAWPPTRTTAVEGASRWILD